MAAAHQIGERIHQEQQLSADAIAWMVCIATAILRAFGSAEASQSMTDLAHSGGVSRPTLYHHLRLAIEALNWVYQNKQRLSHLLSQVSRYRNQCMEAQGQAKQSQQMIQQYWLLLANHKEKLQKLGYCPSVTVMNISA